MGATAQFSIVEWTIVKFDTFAYLVFASLAIVCLGLSREVGSFQFYGITGFGLSLYLIPFYTGVK